MQDRLKAPVLAAGLIGWSLITPRIPERWNPLPQAVFGTLAATLTRAPLGLSPPASRRGWGCGCAAAAPVLLAVAAGTAIPPVRAGMADRTLPEPAGRWLLLRIPVGTVWSEEVGYRAALGDLAERAYGSTAGRLFTAATFGLSHVPDARATGQSVPGTVAVTATAGWVFSWLYAVSGSLVAPMLAHLAVNEAGAVATLAVQRRRSATGATRRGMPAAARRAR